jgi:hypothetical protein
MERKYKFSLRRIVIATTLFAVWCGLRSSHFFDLGWVVRDYPVIGYVFGFIHHGLLPTAVGVLFGRTDIGVLCGIAVALGVYVPYLLGV